MSLIDMRAIGASGYAVLGALCWHQDRNGESFPSVQRIAKLTGLNVRTVQRFLPKLVAADLVRVTARPGRTPRYRVLTPVLSVTPVETVTPVVPVAAPLHILSSGGDKNDTHNQIQEPNKDNQKNNPLTPAAAPAPAAGGPERSACLPGMDHGTPSAGRKAKRRHPPRWPEIPATLDSADFRAAWRDYRAMRREGDRAVPVGATAARKLLDLCETKGLEWSIAALENSTTWSYKRLVHPDDAGRGTSTRQHSNPNGDQTADAWLQARRQRQAGAATA